MPTNTATILLTTLLLGCWKDAPATARADAGPDAALADGAAGSPGLANLEGGVDPGRRPATGALCGVRGRDDCSLYSVCDPTLGCVDCLDDEECPLSARHCIRGACRECDPFPENAAEGGCLPDAPSCWPADGTCHPPCTSGSTCPVNARTCETATGQCVGCRTNEDCANGASGVCSPFTRQCVECIADADCGGSLPRCDLETSRCVECSFDEDCGRAEPICDPDSRRCRVGCTSAAHCPGATCDATTASCMSLPVDAGLDGE